MQTLFFFDTYSIAIEVKFLEAIFSSRIYVHSIKKDYLSAVKIQ